MGDSKTFTSGTPIYINTDVLSTLEVLLILFAQISAKLMRK